MNTQNPTNSLPPGVQLQDPLAQLHDIHLPPAISWWPLAWGWWLLILIIISTLVISFVIIKRHRQRNAYRQQAIIELEAAYTQFDETQHAGYLQTLSAILRRAALSSCIHDFSATIKGREWLLWLDLHCPDVHSAFSKGIGEVLLSGPYQKHPDFDRAALHKLSILWLRKHRSSKPKKLSVSQEELHHA